MSAKRDQIRNARGMGVLDVSLALAIVTVLASTLVVAVPAAIDSARNEAALDQLVRIKRAIVGETLRVRRGERNLTRFGYIGDMGMLPASLADLAEAGAQPDYAVTSVIELGAGWRGPYLPTAPLDFLEDPWGNGIVYDPTPATSASTGAAIIASLRSAGPDGVAGNGDDKVVEIHEGEAFASIFGYVRDSDQQNLSGVTVKLSYPADGTAATASTTTDDTGLYQFTGVPHGERVIQLEPKLQFKKGTAFTLTNALDDVQFEAENLGRDPTSITSFTLTYSSSPQAYYGEVLIDGVQVFNSSTPRAGSGDTISFSEQTVAGTGVVQEAIHMVVSSLAFHVPEIRVGTVGTGGTMTIELNDFRDAATGGGAATVDMTGVTFSIVFSDGSTTIFTTKQQP